MHNSVEKEVIMASRPFVLSIRDGKHMGADLMKARSVLESAELAPRIAGVKLPSNLEAINSDILKGGPRLPLIDTDSGFRVIVDTQLSGGAQAAADEATRILRQTPFGEVTLTVSLGMYDEQIVAVMNAIETLGRDKTRILLTTHLPETSARTLSAVEEYPAFRATQIVRLAQKFRLGGVYGASGDLINVIGNRDVVVGDSFLWLGSGVNDGAKPYGDKVRAITTYEAAGRCGLIALVGTNAWESISPGAYIEAALDAYDAAA